jgi:hypothetical protein
VGDGGLTERALDSRHRIFFAADSKLIVPQGMLLGLGDDNSIDSRLSELLPREDVIGKAMFVYWKSNSPCFNDGW